MTWLELSVDVDPEAVESISELLAQHGYNGGVVIDQPIIPGADGPEYTFDTSRPVTMRTYLPLDAQAEETRQRVEQALWHFGQMRAVGPLRARFPQRLFPRRGHAHVESVVAQHGVEDLLVVHVVVDKQHSVVSDAGRGFSAHVGSRFGPGVLGSDAPGGCEGGRVTWNGPD